MSIYRFHFCKTLCALGAIFVVMGTTQTFGISVAERARPGAGRTNASASRMPTMTAQPAPQPVTAVENNVDIVTEPVSEPDPEPIIIEDKSSLFDSALVDASTSDTDAASNRLADMVRAQRAALDAATATAGSVSNSGGANECDSGLRACMTETCGTNFNKCVGDGDTVWGDKMELCKMKVKCSGAEYNALAPEIKADRDMYVQLATYNEIVNCGNEYNKCIIAECGTLFNKCLGKSAGDTAIAKCEKIAKQCQTSDSGLPSRVMSVFGTLRQNAEVQIAADEKRLYALRDEMKTQCNRLGAMFDERTLDCVFTVNFWAANSDTPYASQKRYAGDTFDCTQDWFGVDVTTFKENAYRETRAQTSASSAMLGAGVGTAVGALSSGAIDRAIDRQKAEKALKAAEKDHQEAFGEKPETSETTTTPENTETSGTQATEMGSKLGDVVAKAQEATIETPTPSTINPTPTTNGFGESTSGGFSNPSLGVDTSLGAGNTTQKKNMTNDELSELFLNDPKTYMTQVSGLADFQLTDGKSDVVKAFIKQCQDRGYKMQQVNALADHVFYACDFGDASKNTESKTCMAIANATERQFTDKKSIGATRSIGELFAIDSCNVNQNGKNVSNGFTHCCIHFHKNGDPGIKTSEGNPKYNSYDDPKFKKKYGII